jgi:hypothetical protein
MLLKTLLTAGLLGSLFPFAGFAQTTPTATRFYVGLGGNQLSNIPFNTDGIVPRIIGPALTVGMQLTPRLAVQTGLSYHWKTDSSAAYQVISNPGSPGASTITITQRSSYFIVPVVLRYTASALTARAHFDVVGGATVVHARGRVTYEGNGGPADPALRERTSSNTRLNVTLGPAVRAALSSHLELTAAGLVSAVVTEDYYRFSDRLFLNASLGLNYTFGQF